MKTKKNFEVQNQDMSEQKQIGAPCFALKAYGVLRNDRGVAIIAALLVLMLLSVVAITSTNTVVSEKAVTRSEAVFERVFFKAESGAMEGVQKIANENTPAELLPNRGGAVNNADLLASAERKDKFDDEALADTDGNGVFDADDVEKAGAGDTFFWDTSEIDASLGQNQATYRRVILTDGGGIEGHESSLKATESRDYYYTAYGYSDTDRGKAMVKVGYVKHF